MRVSRRRRRLQVVRDDLALVRLRFRAKHADDLEGYVVAVGWRWAMLRQIRDGGFFDGWVLFRVRDVKGVRVQDSFERRVAELSGEWPPEALEGRGILSDAAEILSRLPAPTDLVGIEKERERSAIWIGRVEGVDRRFVRLLEVDPQGRWSRSAGYRLDAVTRIEVGTEYLRGLALVAGDPPG